MDPQGESVHKTLDILYKYTAQVYGWERNCFFPVRPKTEIQLCQQQERTMSEFGVGLVYVILSSLLTLKKEYEKLPGVQCYMGNKV